MMNEKIKEAQQLCKDLEYLCSQDDTILEEIIDEYVWLCDDKESKNYKHLLRKNWRQISHDN